MDHETVVPLTDDEYTALKAEAKLTGKKIEALLRELLDEPLARHLRLRSRLQPLSDQELQEFLYREGAIAYIPTGEVDSEETKKERQRLADLLGQAGGGKLASEMVIEDRGPY